MYAIIETGGKQYKVSKGDLLEIELLDAEKEDEVEFDKVLACAGNGEFQVGQPYLEDVKVKGRILEHGKGDKVIIFKYKPKKNYRKKQGHRQPYTLVQIEEISS